MGLVFLVIFGAVLGWLAAIVMRAEDFRSIVTNVILGIGGALFAGVVVHPWLTGSSLLEGRYSVDAILTALFGAVTVLFAANLLRNREAR